MERIIDGKKINVDVIGGFQIEELGKKYAICSYLEDEDSKGLVMIYEVNDDGSFNAVSELEKDIVIETYESLKNELLGDNNG